MIFLTRTVAGNVRKTFNRTDSWIKLPRPSIGFGYRAYGWRRFNIFHVTFVSYSIGCNIWRYLLHCTILIVMCDRWWFSSIILNISCNINIFRSKWQESNTAIVRSFPFRPRWWRNCGRIHIVDRIDTINILWKYQKSSRSNQHSNVLLVKCISFESTKVSHRIVPSLRSTIAKQDFLWMGVGVFKLFAFMLFK